MVLFAYLIFAIACFTFGSSRADLDHVHGSHFKNLGAEQGVGGDRAGVDGNLQNIISRAQAERCEGVKPTVAKVFFFAWFLLVALIVDVSLTVDSYYWYKLILISAH